MTSVRPSSRLPSLDRVDLSEATWRGRAIRYVAIYLSLSLLLVGARFLTQDIRPALRVAQDREATLLTQRNDLAVTVQTLENPQRIRDWAFANGMVRFAEAPKEAQAILPLPPPGEEAGPAGTAPSRSTAAAPGTARPSATTATSARTARPAPSAQPARPAQPGNTVPDNTVEVRTQWR